MVSDRFFRVGSDFGDGSVVMNDRGAYDPEERGGDEGEQEEKCQLSDGAGFFLSGGFSEGAKDLPDKEKSDEEGRDRQTVSNPGEGLPGPLDG